MWVVGASRLGRFAVISTMNRLSATIAPSITPATRTSRRVRSSWPEVPRRRERSHPGADAGAGRRSLMLVASPLMR